MKIRTYTTGYSTELAKQYLNVDEEFVAVTQVVEMKNMIMKVINTQIDLVI